MPTASQILCPLCHGHGSFEDAFHVEYDCHICRATGRVRDTAIIFRAGSTWNLVDVCTLTAESVEDIVECANEWDEDGLMLVIDWCWQRKQDELESNMTIECNADVGHPCDADDGAPCPACVASQNAESRYYGGARHRDITEADLAEMRLQHADENEAA